MSNLENYRQAYYSSTAKLSDNARTLSLSAIAVIWLFKIDGKNGQITLEPELYSALLWVVGSLICDLLQYLYSGLAWGIFSRVKERQGYKPEDQLIAPYWINWPTILLYYAKIILLVISYLLIILFLSERLTH
ncbi:hypothetical protein [Aeromonas sp. 603607]|uniref:hypothetical protein n=1 Tax=Aeromonas sp. 603607 TaxID=2712048 RepID=UPI003B9EF733